MVSTGESLENIKVKRDLLQYMADICKLHNLFNLTLFILN